MAYLVESTRIEAGVILHHGLDLVSAAIAGGSDSVAWVNFHPVIADAHGLRASDDEKTQTANYLHFQQKVAFRKAALTPSALTV